MTRLGSKRATRLLIALGSCLALAVVSAPAYAISGSAGSVDAAAAQYVAGNEDPDGETFPLGEETPPGEETPESVVLPEDEANPLPVAAQQQEPQQDQNASGDLPLTGYVVITTLAAGLLALMLGLWLRRRTEPYPR